MKGLWRKVREIWRMQWLEENEGMRVKRSWTAHCTRCGWKGDDHRKALDAYEDTRAHPIKCQEGRWNV
jgi:hypothetical protein